MEYIVYIAFVIVPSWVCMSRYRYVYIHIYICILNILSLLLSLLGVNSYCPFLATSRDGEARNSSCILSSWSSSAASRQATTRIRKTTYSIRKTSYSISKLLKNIAKSTFRTIFGPILIFWFLPYICESLYIGLDSDR